MNRWIVEHQRLFTIVGSVLSVAGVVGIYLNQQGSDLPSVAVNALLPFGLAAIVLPGRLDNGVIDDQE
ncbi:MAG TPA: hypothetical protein VFK41_08975 [Nocardioidaceae bacterium]|nr:hypothetical protein [Nocardioidaceae bacterium]